MANFFEQFLQGAGSGAYQQDYKHASKLFVDGNHRLSPKYGFLYHVSFEFNPLLQSQLMRSSSTILETGMLVKSAQLPKFTVDTKSLNAYNRVNVAQTKFKYDPLTITFHDDSSEVIRNFWFDYYDFYYRDSGHAKTDFAVNTKYSQRKDQNWGYTPRSDIPGGSSDHVITAIHIYSLHQRKFTEYILMNPTITAFKFGDHVASEGTSIMEASMSVAYEAVLYGNGTVVPGNSVGGLGTLHYDTSPSPLTAQGGGTQSIFGPGGLVSALDTVDHLLGQGDILGAGVTAFKSYNNFKGANFGQMATSGLMTIGQNVLTGSNPLSKIQIPSFGGAINDPGTRNYGPSTTGFPAIPGAIGAVTGAVSKFFAPEKPTNLATSNGEPVATPFINAKPSAAVPQNQPTDVQGQSAGNRF